jgi:hypothetical protein
MKDPSSRTITISVKVSRGEAAALKALAKNTSPGKGLRELIDRYLWRKQ